MMNRMNVCCGVLLALVFGMVASADGDIIARSYAYVGVNVHIGNGTNINPAGGACYTESNIAGGGYTGQTDYDQNSSSIYDDITSYVEQADVRNMAQGRAYFDTCLMGAWANSVGEAELSGELVDFAWGASLSDALSGITRTNYSGIMEIYVSYNYVVDLLNANHYIPASPGDEVPEAEVMLKAALLDGTGTNILTPTAGWQQGNNCLEMTVSSQSPGFYQADSNISFFQLTFNEDETYTAWSHAEVLVQSPMAMPGLYVSAGLDQGGPVNGGSGVLGGLDIEFDEVTSAGYFNAIYDPVDLAEMTPEELAAIDFVLPTDPVMMWDVEFTGEFAGLVELTFGYDDSYLLPGFDEGDLWVWHKVAGPAWEQLTVLTRDLDNNTITVLTDSFSTFALGGAVPEPTFASLMLVGGIGLLRRRRKSGT